MGSCKSKIKEEIKQIREDLKSNYVCKSEIEMTKNDLRSGLANALDMMLPILEKTLLIKNEEQKKREINELSKSFVVKTFQQVNKQVETLTDKIHEIDKTKVTKAVYNKNDDTVNFC